MGRWLRLIVLVSALALAGCSSASVPQSHARPFIHARAIPARFGLGPAPAVGQQLVVTPGSWGGNPTRFTYQWQDCDGSGNNCGNINGATSSSYTVQASDVGFTLVVVIVAYNGQGSASQTSAATGVVAGSGGPAPVNTTAPYFCGVTSGLAGCSAVTGSAVTGQTLTVSQGAWTNSPTSFTYQWEDCSSTAGQPPTTGSCSNISGATSASYTVQAGDAGSSITPIVTAFNGSTASTPTTVAGSCATGSTIGGGGGAPSGSVDPAEPAGCSPISAVAASTSAGVKLCTNAPVTCGLPDPISGNAGVPPGTSLTTVGSINCTNTTINGVQINGGTITIGSNCILENSLIEGSNNAQGYIQVGSGATTGVQLLNDNIVGQFTGDSISSTCTYTPSAVNGGSGASFTNVHWSAAVAGLTLNHDYLHCGAENINGEGNVSNTYIISDECWGPCGSAATTHNEAAYLAGSGQSGGTFSNDVILNPYAQTAGIFTDCGADGPATSFTVSGNLAGTWGSNGALGVNGSPCAATSNVSVTNNRYSFIYNSAMPCGYANGTGVTFTGNIKDSTAASLASC